MRRAHSLLLATTALWLSACEDLPRREPVFNDWDVVDTGSLVTSDAFSDAGTDTVLNEDGADDAHRESADTQTDVSTDTHSDAATDADMSEWADANAESDGEDVSDADADADPDSADEDVIQGGSN